MKIRVMLVDDHFVVRAGLCAVLGLQPDLEVVAQAESGLEALEAFEIHRPAVTLLDLRLPDMSGIEVTRKLRAQHSDARLLMLTTYDGDEEIYQALDAGACGYQLKSAPAVDLLAAIRSVQNNGSYIPDHLARRIAQRGARESLTLREIEVLKLLAKGLSNREIGAVLGCSPLTAKTHVQRILEKLHAANRTEAATVAAECGFLSSEAK
jgi:two-component system NarL family response regulator